jgi:PST family polysaccharide transporter
LWESVGWESYLEHLTPQRVRAKPTNFHRWVAPMIQSLPGDFGTPSAKARMIRSVRQWKKRVRSRIRTESGKPSDFGKRMATDQEVLDPFSVEHLQDDLKGRSVRGGTLSLVAQVAQILLQSVSTIVLARLLTPVDFGLVAMVTSITAIANGFADLGLTEATIQRAEINHRQVSTLFWINTGMGLILTLITAGMAPLLAWFYKDPRLVGITLVVSVSFLIGGLRGQHNALLKRQMRFTSVAVRDITASLLAVPVAILLAFRGFGYWAIVALPLATNTAQMVISWWMVDWKPGLPHRDPEVRSLVSFGGNVAASYVVFNWIRNADNVLIGWYWGAGPLGYYSRAFNLLTLALTQVTGPVSSVALPALSRVHSHPELFAKYYLRICNLIGWVVAGLFGFLFVAAKPLIVILLGQKWVAAAPVFQFLAVSALGQMLLESTLWLLISRGDSGKLLKLLLVISPLMIGSFAAGLPFGIKWVAAALSVFLLLSLPWILGYAFRGTTLTVPSLLDSLACPIAVAVFAAACGTFVLERFSSLSLFLQLVVAGASLSAVYCLSFLVPVVRDELNSLWKLVRELRPPRPVQA